MTERRETALITGATGGIGRALAAALSERYDLILCGRDGEKLAALADQFPGAQILTLDLERPETLGEAVKHLLRLDALIHDAGVAVLGTIEASLPEVWRHNLAVNLIAPAELTRVLLPALRAAAGQVVFINSGAGLSASPGWGAYAASKFGLRALADSLRAEEAGKVRVTTVYPGRTATDMQRFVRAQEGGAYQEEAYIQPASVASTVLAALSLPRDAALTELTLKPGG